LESKVNRCAKEAIIVFDRAMVDAKLEAEVGSARYFENCGFVCLVDSQRNDYSAILLVYELARSFIKFRSTRRQADAKIVALIIARFLSDFESLLTLKKKIAESIKQLLDTEKTIEQSLLSIEFSKDVFNTLLERQELTDAELLEFYSADKVKALYAERTRQI
jgi:hypothetical protein